MLLTLWYFFKAKWGLKKKFSVISAGVFTVNQTDKIPLISWGKSRDFFHSELRSGGVVPSFVFNPVIFAWKIPWILIMEKTSFITVKIVKFPGKPFEFHKKKSRRETRDIHEIFAHGIYGAFPWNSLDYWLEIHGIFPVEFTGFSLRPHCKILELSWNKPGN